MHRGLILFIVVFLISSLGLRGQDKQILILHSYAPGNPWSQSLNRGIENVVKPYFHSLQLDYEYLDIRRNSNKIYQESLTDLIELKLENKTYDAVLTCDNSAYEFYVSNKEKLFQNVPMVFCGLNNVKVPERNLFGNQLGVHEHLYLDETIKLIQNVQTDLKAVHIINDNITPTSKALQKQVFEVQEHYPGINFRFLHQLSWDNLLKEVGKIPEDEAILLLSFTKDSDELHYDMLRGVRLIKANTEAPIYSVWDFFSGEGILGGVIIKGEDQGGAAAEMLLQQLGIKELSETTAAKSTPSHTLIDYEEFEKHGLGIWKDESIQYLNKKSSFLEENKHGLFILFALVLLFLIILIVFEVRRQKTVSDFRTTEGILKNFSEVAVEALVIHKQKKIISVNRQFQEMLGYAKDEMVGADIMNFISDDSRERFNNSLNHTNNFRYELSLKTKSGKMIPAEAIGRNYKLNNGDVRVSVFWDISLRLDHERQMRKMLEQLNDSNAQLQHSKDSLSSLLENKDKMLSILSHDLRSPLWGISQGLNLLANEDLSTQEKQELIQDLQKSGKKTVDLMEELLEWAIGMKTDQKLKLEKLDVFELFSEFGKMFSSSMKHKLIDFKLSVDTDIEIETDKRLLTTIIRNFLSNAVKFTENGVVELGAHANGKGVSVFVKDSGIGMSPEQVKNILNSEKLHSSSGTRAEKGTGLGLMLCKELIHRLEGEILVQSEPGEGSKFTLLLPYKLEN